MAVRGVNYIPSYAESAYEIWHRFDLECVTRELEWARNLGFNAVRIPLSYDAFREAPALFGSNLDAFLQTAGELGLRAMPVLFDAWGIDSEDDMGQAREPLAEAYARMLANPEAYRMSAASLKKFETIALELIPDRQVPRSRDPAVLLWGAWRPSPSPEKISRDYWSVYQNYVAQVVKPRASDPRILAWDIMNNPAAGKMLRLRERLDEIHQFVEAMIAEAHASGASQPITLSLAEGYGSTGPVINHLDALSVQSFSESAPDVRRVLLEMKSLSNGRPVYLTLGGGGIMPSSVRNASEENQRRRVRQTLEAAEGQECGWFMWHLIEGKGLSPWAGLLRPDGSPKPAAEYVKQELRRLR